MNSHIRPIQRAFRFVVDTTTLVSYFSLVFYDATPQISPQAIALIDDVFRPGSRRLMVIPSIVFVEIFDIWFRGNLPSDEEYRAKIKAEVYRRIKANPQVEIREIDSEIMEVLLSLQDPIVNLEN